MVFSHALSSAQANPWGGPWEQNCAFQKKCNVPLDQRDPKFNEAGKNDPKGHLQPFNGPTWPLEAWQGELEEVEDMHPEKFWSHYHKNRIPFILKGFAKKSPAYKKAWTDENLKRNYGEFKVKTEPKNEDRLTDYCHGEMHRQRISCPRSTVPYQEQHMQLGDFVDQYHNYTFDRYVVTQMPDALGQDVYVPPFIMCSKRIGRPVIEDDGAKDDETDMPRRRKKSHGEYIPGKAWMSRLYESNFWLNSNEGESFSSSVIHYDMNEQVMCQLRGQKEWIFWDLRTEVDKIPMWGEYYRPDQRSLGSDDSPIDMERVDLKRWPEFATAKWTNGTLDEGDCLYTPANSLHYVRSSGARNMAWMTMLRTTERYHPDACVNFTTADHQEVRLSEFDTLWGFPGERDSPGYNMIKMGFPDWRAMWKPIAKYIKQRGGGRIDRKTLFKLMNHQLGQPEYFETKYIQDRFADAFESMNGQVDSNKGKVVQIEHVLENKKFDGFLRDVSVLQESGPELDGWLGAQSFGRMEL